MKGYWLFILHSHLPFTKHPEFEYFLEEHWLFEAITETYIPFLMMLKKLEEEHITNKITVSVTPPLAEMCADEILVNKYKKYLNQLIELSEKEIERTKNNLKINELAIFYNEKFTDIKNFFYGFLNESILNGYKYFLERGNLEIITSAATHGFLPLLSVNKKAVEIQISLGVKNYIKHFKKAPQGIWIPENAYYSGLDEVLKEFNIKYCFVDSQGLIYGKPTPKYGVFAPIFTKNEIAIFARDPESSKQVWSSKEGYPGDFNYRDFYRDIGYDLDFEYIKPYISPDGIRVFTGIKYHKITGTTDSKDVYNPKKAFDKTREHALNFHFNTLKQLEHLSTLMDRKPIITSMYDAELFGHWWFEGVDFIYNLFKVINEYKEIEPISALEYLKKYPLNQIVTPSPSSWGDKGYYNVWLNNDNDWIYRHLHYMSDTMQLLASTHFDTNINWKVRTLNQMLRELLLAQSSDWAFLITTKTAYSYSVTRTKEHISNFLKLQYNLENDNNNEDFLSSLEKKDSIFQDIDFKVYK